MGWDLTSLCWAISPLSVGVECGAYRDGSPCIHGGTSSFLLLVWIIYCQFATDASDGRGSSAELVVRGLHHCYPSSSSCRQLKQGADIGSAVCLIPWDTLLLGVWPHAARAVLVLSQGGEWISSLLPNVLALATKPECVKKDPCPTPPWWAPWVVQSLTREAGGHRGSFPLKLIICIHVGTVCTCHCICLSLCDFGALGSLRFLIFLGYQFFQFLALKSCTI